MELKKELNILIADDHDIIRMGLTSILNSISPSLSFFYAESIQKVKNHFVNNRFDLLILDLALEDGFSIDLITHIKNINPSVKILVFTAMSKDLYEAKLIKLGINRFVEKSSSELELQKEIIHLINDPAIELPQERKNIKTPSPFSILSKNELIVLTYLTEGYTMKAIANQLSLKSTTVSTYKRRIFEKLKITGIVELIEYSELFKWKTN